MNRRGLMQLGVLICSTLLGIVLADVLARLLILKAGEYYLSGYAARLEQVGIRIDEESASAYETISASNLPLCTPPDIALLRSLLFRSSEMKDIGRTRAGMFLCSAGVGALPKPLTMPVPDHVSSAMKTYAATPVMVGDRARGFILQTGDITFVLNPGAFDGLDEPGRSFAAFVYDPQTRDLVQDYGAKLPLANPEILAARLIQRRGVYYLPVCSAPHRVCVVAVEDRRSFGTWIGGLRHVLLFVGGVVGNCIALIALLLLRKHRSPEKQLRRALLNGDVHLVYQPIVNLQSRRTVGAEALARWVNEDGESVSPEIFVLLAEQRGFVTQLTRYVVRTVLAELEDLLASDDFRVTVNITSEDLTDRSFFDFMESSLSEAGVRASSIGLEITERSTVNREIAIAAIARLRAAGHTIYLDDFGTGYSSLAYLRDLSVDCIKIDRAFTATLGTHAVTEIILPQVLSLAVTLDLCVAAEGVETAAQADYFEAAGRGILAQGWYFSRPLQAAALRRYLQQSHAAAQVKRAAG